MGFWKRLEERIWTGKTIRDYGEILEEQSGIARRRVSVVLTEGKRGRRLFIRTSQHAWLAASVQFVELDREAVLKLREAVEDALPQME